MMIIKRYTIPETGIDSRHQSQTIPITDIFYDNGDDIDDTHVTQM